MWHRSPRERNRRCRPIRRCGCGDSWHRPGEERHRRLRLDRRRRCRARYSTGSARSDRPPALVQAGDSKTACISGEPGTSDLRQAELATHMTFNCIVTYTDADPTWADWVNPWITIKGYSPFVAWVAADPTGHQLVDTQNLIPNSETNNPKWTAQCAAGDYNTYATQFAKTHGCSGLRLLGHPSRP